MRKNFTMLLVIPLLAVSCSRGVSRIHRHSLPVANPTTWSFPVPIEDVQAKALQVFSSRHQIREPAFGKPADTAELWSTLSAECSTNAVSGKAVFADPANAHDIYVHSSHSPFALSPVYQGRNGGLPFIAAFHLHLASSGADTVVTITASNTKVINGRKFTIGSCGPVMAWNCVKVKPTTIEEYTVLRYLGRHLGLTDMPEVLLPAQMNKLSKDEK